MRKIALLVLALCLAIPQAVAQVNPFPGWGFDPAAAGLAPTNAPYVLTPGSSFDPMLSAERVLRLPAGGGLTFVDNGANGFLDLSINAPVSYANGGTAQITRQLAINGLLAAAAKGDLPVYNGTNIVNLSLGTDTYVLRANSATATGLEWFNMSSLGPPSSQYIVSVSDAGLPNADVLTQGTGILVTNGVNVSTVAIDTTVVDTLTGANTLTNKILTSPKFNTQWSVEAGTFDPVFTVQSPGQAVSIRFPDPGTASTVDVVLTAGAQSIGGVKTLTSQPVVSGSTISVGGFVQTFPGAAGTLANLATAQTLTNKTIDNPLFTNGFTVDTAGAGNFVFVTSGSPGTDRQITLADPSGNDTIAYLAANQTFTGKHISTSQVDSGSAFGIAFGGTNNASLVVTAGVIPRGDGTKLLGLALGSANQQLRVNAGATDIEWFTNATVGTVTSFSAGNLSPLFTSSVATATSTPALTFSLSTAAAYTLFGNNTSSTAAPAA